MRSYTRLVFPLLLIGLVAASVFGCGKLPTAPSSVQTSAAPTVSTSAQPEGLLSGVGGIVNTLIGLIVRVLNLVGSLGGSLNNGRWHVVVPAGAVDGNATIALGVPNTSSPDCKLEIWPSDKNHFSVPVRLTVNCSSVLSDQLRNYVIYWYNPTTKTWVEVSGSTVDLTHKTVSAPLQHFSGYSVGPKGGKAGW